MDESPIIKHNYWYIFDEPNHKQMKPYLIQLVFIFSTLTLFSQQNSDLVYLQGGSILKGKIVSQTDSLLSIKIIGGSVFAFKSGEIEKISVYGGTVKSGNIKPGYQCYISAGSLVGSSKNEKEAPISLLTEQNIGIKSHASFGLTTGIEIINESVIPIGANFKGILPLSSGNSLFSGISGGYLLSLEKPYDPYDIITDNQGGTFVNVEIGMFFLSAGTAQMFMAMGYRYAELHYKTNEWWYAESTQNQYFSRFSVRIGVLLQ